MALLCVQLVLLEVEFCLNMKQQQQQKILYFYQILSSSTILLSTGEWGGCQRCNYMHITSYVLISLCWLTLDDLKMIMRWLQSTLLEWNFYEMENHWSRASQIPLCSRLKSLMRLERHRNHFHLALCPYRGRFFSGHLKQNLFLCATCTGSGFLTWNL